MPNITDWVRLHGTFYPDPNKQVDYVDLQLAADDAVCKTTGNVDAPIYFTDIQFQGGDKLTGWVPHTQEMVQPLTYDVDESKNIATPNVINGAQPTTYNDMETRFYNIVGRGHSVITLPNYYPEDWDKEILPTGVDFTIYPKEDFDLCRISTNIGEKLPEELQRYRTYIEQDPDNADFWDNHPLHFRYTREFWIDGASAGTEIKIHASTRTHSVNGVNIPIAGIREFSITQANWTVPINRMRFFLAPRGSIRFRIEFYKHITDVTEAVSDYTLQDKGIGFYGTAEFKQFTYGRNRL